MKRVLIILCIECMSSLAGLCPPAKVIFIPLYDPVNPYEKLWKVVCLVESQNNPSAYNKKEQATGIAQIRPILLKDYNQRTGSRLNLYEMYDINKSKKVFLYYCHRHKNFTYEKFAKFWNGRGKQNMKYWHRIKSEL